MNLNLESVVGALTMLRDFDRMERLIERAEKLVADPSIKEFVMAVKTMTGKGPEDFGQVSREFVETVNLLMTRDGRPTRALKAKMQPPKPRIVQPTVQDNGEEPEPVVHNPDLAQAAKQKQDREEAAPERHNNRNVMPIL